MIWTIDQEPANGIMFRGQGTVSVKNRRGETGVAKVEYFPVCRVVGPVVTEVGRDDEGYPTEEAEVIDRRPTFRS
jgi:hypothetical protein